MQEGHEDWENDRMSRWPQVAGEYHCYSMGPIDAWEGWRVVPGDEYGRVIHELESALGKLGWDSRNDRWRDGRWRVSSLPDPDTCGQLAVFATKQDNNGTTYICSPYPLPWIEREASEKLGQVRLVSTVIQAGPNGA